MEGTLINPKARVAEAATVLAVNPCEHQGWDTLLAAKGDSSFFHSAAWAQVLQETYGHRPCYFCRIEEGRLRSLLPLMEVASSVTGRRGVGLPFTDTCYSPQAQANGAGDSGNLYERAMEHGRERGWRYLEFRGDAQGWEGASVSVAFHGHVVELQPDPEPMFKKLEGSVRRGIRKAEHGGIKVEFSDTPEAMDTYYRLHCRTRRRHGVPPQPKKFFDNIARYVLGVKRGFVAIGTNGSQPIAAAVFLYSESDAIYKFGASDFAFQHLRPNNLVMWQAIKRLGTQGCTGLHMGRTSLANEGLRRFKLGFGAREERIEYSRYDFRNQAFVRSVDRAESWANNVFRLLPSPALRIAGRLLYPHLS